MILWGSIKSFGIIGILNVFTMILFISMYYLFMKIAPIANPFKNTQFWKKIRISNDIYILNT